MRDSLVLETRDAFGNEYDLDLRKGKYGIKTLKSGRWETQTRYYGVMRPDAGDVSVVRQGQSPDRWDVDGIDSTYRGAPASVPVCGGGALWAWSDATTVHLQLILAKGRSEVDVDGSLVALDPLDQRVRLEVRALQWRDDVLEAEEEHTIDIGLYFTHELRALIERAGFTDVVLHGGHEEREPTADDDFGVFVAGKPASGA